MLNVDRAELDKFSAMAQSWWDRDGACRPLHDLNPCRLSFITERVTLDAATVLDVGCGGGILTEALAQTGARATGIDAEQALVDVATEHASTHGIANVKYACVEIENWANDERYDVITCMELLEHVPQPEQMIAQCARRLNPGGSLFFSTLNRSAQAYAQAIIGAEYLLQLLPRGTHDYDKFIKPSELAQWARATGLQLQDVQGMTYNPFRRKARLCKSLKVNYLAHFVAQ